MVLQCELKRLSVWDKEPKEFFKAIRAVVPHLMVERWRWYGQGVDVMNPRTGKVAALVAFGTRQLNGTRPLQYRATRRDIPKIVKMLRSTTKVKKNDRRR